MAAYRAASRTSHSGPAKSSGTTRCTRRRRPAGSRGSTRSSVCTNVVSPSPGATYTTAWPSSAAAASAAARCRCPPIASSASPARDTSTPSLPSPTASALTCSFCAASPTAASTSGAASTGPCTTSRTGMLAGNSTSTLS